MYSIVIAERFKKLCEPFIFEYGLNYISMLEYNISDNTVIIFSTQAEVAEFILSNIKDLSSNSLRINLGEEGFKEFIWPTNANHKIFKALNRFGIQNGFSVMHRSNNIIENWNFGASKDSLLAIDLFLNKPEIFRLIISYLKEKLPDFKKEFGHQCLFKNIESPIFNIASTSIKAPQVSQKNYTILFKDGNITLTPRQNEVIYYLLQGKTSKEIALILKISPRTIEDHIYHLKAKVNVHTQTELIKAFQNALLPIPLKRKD
jgi:DNA-binding CsgD family transcriptional regulator